MISNTTSMKNVLIYIKNVSLVAALMLLLNTGCVELEETPMDFTGPTNFYKSSGQIESAFASAMARLYSEWSAYSYGHGYFAHDDQLFGGNLVISDDHGSDLWNAH